MSRQTKYAKTRKSTDSLKPAEFSLADHGYARHDAVVSGRKTIAEIVDPKFWSLVAFKLSPGDEIRVLADDCSFRAELLCTYAHGTEVRMVELDFLELDQVDYEALDAQTGGYEIKQRGVKKWCILKTDTGEVIKENIPTQAAAAKELEEYKRALAA